MAVTDRAKGHHGISAFIIERGTPGMSPGRKENKLGMRASETSEVVFQDCRIPLGNLLGEEGHGYANALQVLDAGRIGIAALAVGLAQGAHEAALRYAKQRRQFGASIARIFRRDRVRTRLGFGAGAVIGLGIIYMRRFIPESPRWLAKAGRYDEALAVLTRVDGADLAQREMAEIRQSIREETGTLAELFRPGLRMALIVAVGRSGENSTRRLVAGPGCPPG